MDTQTYSIINKNGWRVTTHKMYNGNQLLQIVQFMERLNKKDNNYNTVLKELDIELI